MTARLDMTDRKEAKEAIDGSALSPIVGVTGQRVADRPPRRVSDPSTRLILPVVDFTDRRPVGLALGNPLWDRDRLTLSPGLTAPLSGVHDLFGAGVEAGLRVHFGVLLGEVGHRESSFRLGLRDLLKGWVRDRTGTVRVADLMVPVWALKSALLNIRAVVFAIEDEAVIETRLRDGLVAEEMTMIEIISNGRTLTVMTTNVTEKMVTRLRLMLIILANRAFDRIEAVRPILFLNVILGHHLNLDPVVGVRTTGSRPLASVSLIVTPVPIVLHSCQPLVHPRIVRIHLSHQPSLESGEIPGSAALP